MPDNPQDSGLFASDSPGEIRGQTPAGQQTGTARQTASGSLLLSFRSESKQRLPLHPLERAVLTVVALHLSFLPWALGATNTWAQITSLCMSTLGFLLALIPRIYAPGEWPGLASTTPLITGGNHPEQAKRIEQAHRPPVTAYRVTAWPRLLRFPLFWIGLALLAYIAIQGYNPSWVWERNESTWWLRRVNDIPWLPTSIDSPFERFNLWRQFIIYASVWLTACTAWVGFTRRRTFETLLYVIIGNAFALAAFGGLQRVTGDFYIHDLLKARAATASFSSFIYHNHAGAYLALAAALALALACRHAFGRLDPSRRSTPAPLFLLLAVALTVTVVMTKSRGATLTLAGTALLTALFVALPGFKRNMANGSNRWIMITVAALFAGILSLSIYWLNFEAVTKKFGRAIEQREDEANIRSRLIAHQAAFTMLKQHGLRGIGAGGFRHYFTEYVQSYPEISRFNNRPAFWEHAHNDWLQIPIEQGAAGTALFLVGAGWCALTLVRRRAWRYPLALVLIFGCGQTLMHAWFDFPFQNPAILLTWIVLIITTLRWLEIEGK